jgi:hypothetical protein
MPLASVTAASRERGNQSVRKLLLICKAWMLLGRGSPNPRGPAATAGAQKTRGSEAPGSPGGEEGNLRALLGKRVLPICPRESIRGGATGLAPKVLNFPSVPPPTPKGTRAFMVFYLRSLCGRTKLPTTFFRGQAPGAGTAPWARRSTWLLPRESPLQQSFLPLPRHPDRVQLPNLLRQ